MAPSLLHLVLQQAVVLLDEAAARGLEFVVALNDPGGAIAWTRDAGAGPIDVEALQRDLSGDESARIDTEHALALWTWAHHELQVQRIPVLATVAGVTLRSRSVAVHVVSWPLEHCAALWVLWVGSHEYQRQIAAGDGALIRRDYDELVRAMEQRRHVRGRS